MEKLITTRWLPVIYRDGTYGKMAPTDLANEDIVDIAAPRADFQGAAWQFLIGLLQTSLAPEDWFGWDDIWEEGLTTQRLCDALAPFESAFVFGPDAPSFMQDFQPLEGETVSVATLLPEIPGQQTLKRNTDHFIKRGGVETMCPHCAALALFALQLNAPSGGKGYRTGLRGGGPITTLVTLHQYKDDLQPPLWRKLWLNVMPQQVGRLPIGRGDDPRIFPWLAPTRTSENAGGITTPEQGDPLQAYWGMPRRIRLDFDHTRSGECDLCGEASDALLDRMAVKNYGINYEGWRHPLTPYRTPQKEGGETFSLKGQPGGLMWRDWLGLSLGCQSDNNHERPAQVVAVHLDNPLEESHTGLWAFGYDFDNMKARCWYEHHLPLLRIPSSQQPFVRQTLQSAAACAVRALSTLRTALKEAWFDNPKHASGDFSFIDADFWQQTQPDFLALIEQVKATTDGDDRALLTGWQGHIWRFARRYFDQHAISNPQEQTDFSRIMRARKKFMAPPSDGKGRKGKKPQEAIK